MTFRTAQILMRKDFDYLCMSKYSLVLLENNLTAKNKIVIVKMF